MRPTLTLVALTALFVAATARPVPSQGFDTPRTFRLVEATIPELTAALETHQINSKQLVKLYLDRIAAYEGTLNAMIRVNPNAIAIAHQRDVERAQGDIRGPLHGIPIVLKDNVHTLDMITTGGALAFANLRVPYESTLSQKLRDAGAIILGHILSRGDASVLLGDHFGPERQDQGTEPEDRRHRIRAEQGARERS